MIGFLLTCAAALCLALGMNRHFRQLLPGATLSSTQKVAFRAAGWTLVIAAAWACIVAEGVGVGLTLFAAYFTTAHFALALVLSTRPDGGKRRRT